MRSFSFYLPAVLLVFLLSASSSQAQTEAQSSEEFMEFQNIQKPKTTTQIKLDYRLKTPAVKRNAETDQKGRVIGFTDSTIVVMDLQTEKEREINPGKVSSITIVRRKVRLLGWIIFGGAALGALIWAVVTVIGSTSSFGPFIVLGILGATLANPFFWLGLTISSILWIVARKVIFPKKWTWKRKRLVTIKKKGR